ncbi:MAG TPA: hypothetical protein VEQ59_03805, partial [Polyangiaceae bacterium]|nr:hypothetical protein [Polyangiaceae bacterium]
DGGDVSVMLVTEYARIVSNLFVVYASSPDAPLARLLGLKGLQSGYNLIELPQVESDQAFIEYARCQFDAQVQAAASSHDQDGDGQPDAQEVRDRKASLERASCPAFRVVTDPAAERVELNLGSLLPSL